MAEFIIELNEDNTVKRVLRDGAPDSSAGQLEQLFSIVTIYFRLANSNLNQMRSMNDAMDRRACGVQAFIMSLTGLEAFANTYFHLRAREIKRLDLEQRVEQNRSTLAQKFRDLIALVGDPEMHDQEALLARIFQFSSLRNALVHPRWTPSSLVVSSDAPIVINDLVENFQAQFENQRFCHEALFWCLLVVARIAEARGNSDVSGFMFHWTGNYGLTLRMILQQLGLDE